MPTFTSPKLSVIIPTRERSDVLAHTLRTLVEQDYGDCEFLVSDNASQDATKEIVARFNDSRIRYIKSSSRMSMAGNWDFALKSAKGSYVTCLGDDDGFIPGALSVAMRVLERSAMNALVWKKIEYTWPDYVNKDRQNIISLANRNYATRLSRGRGKLRQVMASRDGYNALPCLYNGIIKRSLIDHLRTKSINGVLFNAIAPDVFSSIIISRVVGHYLYTNYPFSVNGASRHSIGTAFMTSAADKLIIDPSTKFLGENECTYDSRLLLAPSIVNVVMGEYLLAKKYIPDLKLPEPSWGSYVRNLILSARTSQRPDDIYRSASHTIKCLNLDIRIPTKVTLSDLPSVPVRGISGDRLNIFVPKAMVKNVYEACQLVAGMIPSEPDKLMVSPLLGSCTRIAEFTIGELKWLSRTWCLP
jgi:glycosyltransferase involved in cell wall biosynthesis